VADTFHARGDGRRRVARSFLNDRGAARSSSGSAKPKKPPA
jgi:hypothetical protein